MLFFFLQIRGQMGFQRYGKPMGGRAEGQKGGKGRMGGKGRRVEGRKSGKCIIKTE
jgi:hypothetical protein